jgi:hypothetical protein
MGLRHDFTLGSVAAVAVGEVGPAWVGAVVLAGIGTLGSGAGKGAEVGSAKLTAVERSLNWRERYRSLSRQET